MKKTIKTECFLVRLLFKTDARRAALYWCLTGVKYAIPLLGVWIWKLILDELTLIYQTHAVSHVVGIYLSIYLVLQVVASVITHLNSVIYEKIERKATYHMDMAIMRKMTEIDTAFFDDPSNATKLKAANTSESYITGNMCWAVDTIIRLITFVSGMIVFLSYKDLFFEGACSEVRLYHLRDYLSSLYTDIWELWDKAVHAKNIMVCLINIASLVLLTVNEVIVYILSVIKLIAGEIAVGDVAYYVSLLTQFRQDFTSLCYRINMFGKNTKELNDVRSFVEMEPLLEHGGTMIPAGNPKIEFKDVSFRYPSGDHDVLSHCSFTIEQGETVGLVGLNGCGKSTIVKLMCRFYDPSSGEILIDGVSNKEYDIVKLRELFGVLFQDYVRYSFSLRENVALSKLEKKDCDADILRACSQSRIDFIKDWENGIDENLTRRFDRNGKNLSGGQWQRISLARAFFRDAPIILLDEPSASLDPVAEHQIFEDFSKISESKSAVLISHRLSSITLADKILVLENGHIIEQGSHDDLLRRDGRYAYLFNLQASKYI